MFLDVPKRLSDSVNKLFYDHYNQLISQFSETVELNATSPPHSGEIIQRFFYKFLLIYFLQSEHFFSDSDLYLQNMFEQVVSINGNYYKDFLKKCFEIIFDSEISDFFEKYPISNNIFTNIFSVLYDYHWTIDESTKNLDGKTLTPDVLGYIFERSLILRNKKNSLKKQHGIYYSPKNISLFITKKSLECYLLSKVNIFYTKDYKLFDDIYRLDKTELREIATYLVINVIFNLTVLDNACGSGEFLVSVFYELVEVWTTIFYHALNNPSLQEFIHTILYQYNFMVERFNWSYSSINDFKKDKNWQYFIKWIILTRNIYGVDIDKEALEITKMRLWLLMLSGNTCITTDESPMYRLLPILDNNIRLGNSLIGYGRLELKTLGLSLGIRDKKEIERMIFRDQINNKLFEKNFSLTTINTVKDLLILKSSLIELCFDINSYQSEKIQTIINFLTEILYKTITPFFYAFLSEPIKNEPLPEKIFHWHVEYPKIMNSSGFDIIIGNPPYITLTLGKKQHIFDQTELEIFKTLYSDSSQYKGNLYSIFIERSLHLLKVCGVLGFIVPNTLLLNHTTEKIRKMILQNSHIKFLINIKDKIFEHVEVGGHAILIVSKTHINESYEVQVAELSKKEDLQNTSTTFSTIKQQYYLQIEKYKLYTNLGTFDLLEKIAKNTKKLGDIVNFYQGIITGDNSLFITNYKLDESYKPLIRGKDIHKYSLTFNNRYILFDKTKLWSNTNEKYYLSKEKLISRQTGDKLLAVYDDHQYYSLDSTHIQILKDNNFSLKYILALFNSTLLNFYYRRIVQEDGRPFAQVKIVNLKKLPIKVLSLENQQPFVKLVDKLLCLYKEYTNLSNIKHFAVEKIIDEIKNIENTLNKLVYSVYELTEDEIKIIEN